MYATDTHEPSFWKLRSRAHIVSPPSGSRFCKEDLTGEGLPKPSRKWRR